jgi:PIN domain nuclease of toxin-antitoxin system
VRLLLDTHTLVWAVTAPRRIPHAVLHQISDRRNAVYFSPVSIFEIASKRASGSRNTPGLEGGELGELAVRTGFQELLVTFRHAAAAEHVALLHADPFDRLLLAQAKAEGLQLVTHDETLAQYDSRTILF